MPAKPPLIIRLKVSVHLLIFAGVLADCFLLLLHSHDGKSGGLVSGTHNNITVLEAPSVSSWQSPHG